MELKDKVINFLGDSITQGVGVAEPANIYVNRIKDMCALKAANNYGLSGTRFAKQTIPTDPASFDEDFCLRSLDMDKDADVIVVFGGTNDYGHGDAPIGTRYDRTPDTFWGACHTLMSGLLTNYPAATIVICTPLHREGEDSPDALGRKPAPVGTLREYVEIIRTVAEYYSLPVLDLFAMGGMQPNVPAIKERYVPDGLHPNDAGHALLADRIAGFLKAL